MNEAKVESYELNQKLVELKVAKYKSYAEYWELQAEQHQKEKVTIIIAYGFTVFILLTVIRCLL